MQAVEAIHFKKVTETYAHQPTKQGDVALQVDLCIPRQPRTTFPLMVWMHAGGFRSGTRRNLKHGLLADVLARHGYASAFIDYRLARPAALLRRRSRRMARVLTADARASGEEMQESFWGQRPIAVVEDCAAFFAWIGARRAEYRLNGDYLLGGSSAGAISALNTLFLAPHLRLAIPPIRSAFVVSGAFAYPSFYAPCDTRILALHNPQDVKVPVPSIRRLAARAASHMTLIESDQMEHGMPLLSSAETWDQAVLRFLAMDQAGVDCGRVAIADE